MMLSRLLNDARSAAPYERARLLEQTSDVFLSRRWSSEEGEQAVQELVALAAAEKDSSLREILLNALVTAYSQGILNPCAVSLSPLVETLDELSPPLLDAALYLLALTYDVEYRSVIAAYLEHPDEAIRVSAAEALAEIDAKR